MYKRQTGTVASTREDDDNVESDYIRRLALLLNIFAAGAAGDLTLPVGNDEAELYNNLARAALSLKSVFTGASMESANFH